MKYLYLVLIILLGILPAEAQYISRSQLPDNSCPTVCPGSVITLEVFQVQNLNVGDTLQAWMSNATGSFASGTVVLNPIAYSLNTGTSWTIGPYLYSASVNNLYIQIQIPANQPVGTGYTIYMKSSSGYVSTNLFQCSGTNAITVTSAYPTLGNLAINAEGINQWIGHAYTWTSTVAQPLFTTPLVDSQDFFNPANYQGYFLKNSLSFDLNWVTSAGGNCPGTPGVMNDGTNIPCSQAYSTLFSVRFLRKENFAPGTYRLSIQGDDGIRLSIDGGATWLLSSYFEQMWNASYNSTDTLYPSGICLSGETDLVIEFFQRNVDARATFTATQLTSTTVPASNNQTTCSGGNVNFNLAGAPGGLNYQWYYSTNNGTSFGPVPNSAPFTGVTTSDLGITGVPAGYNGYEFYCSITGVCANAVHTPTDTLFVQGGGAATFSLGNDTSYCGAFSKVLSSGIPTTRWSTGVVASQITVTTPGTYWALDSTGCGSFADTITISQGTGTTVNIGNDTNYCGAFTRVLSSGIAATTWSTGATGPQITVTTPGIYWVQDSTGCGVSRDSVNITEGAPPAINLGPDTTYCGAFIRVLSTGIGTTIWSTGVTASSITESSSGTYWALDSTGCGTSRDSIILSQNVLPIVDIGNDTTLCTGQTLILDAGNPGATFQWQDNSSGETYTVSSAGQYSVKVTSGGCSATGYITVAYTSGPVAFTLGNDITICPDSPATFNAYQPNVSYLWSTGATSASIIVSQAGTYSVTDVNSCGTASASVVVDTSSAGCIDTTVIYHNPWYIPNAFSPNGDGINDYFQIYGSRDGMDYLSIKIFDRWGEKVFESNDLYFAWDGTYKWQKVSSGLFVYELDLAFRNTPSIHNKGSITLIK